MPISKRLRESMEIGMDIAEALGHDMEVYRRHPSVGSIWRSRCKRCGDNLRIDDGAYPTTAREFSFACAGASLFPCRPPKPKRMRPQRIPLQAE